MPTLNRCRAANVHFDHDRKCYHDETFSFWGRSGLLSLENGGGKTLLMRLICHTVLGMEPMAGRRFLRGMLGSDHRRCSWSLVEFRLDDPDHYLLVGLVFALQSGEPHWFQFVVEYRDDDPFDLGQLRLTEDGQWLRYDEFHRRLQQAARERNIKLFSLHQRGDSSRYLATYRVFRHDWEEILRNNGDEGGLTNLYRRFGTSKQLLQGQIIPRISSALSAEGADDLVEALHNHARTLQEIPQLRQQQQAFDRLATEAEALLGVLTDYQSQAAALDRVHREVLGASQLAAAEWQRLQVEQQVAAVKLQDLAAREQELAWEQESLRVLAARQDLEEKRELLAVEEERRDRQRVVVSGLEQRRTVALATNDYLDQQERLAEAARLAARIAAAQQSEPELVANCQAAEAVLKAHLLAATTDCAAAVARVDAEAAAIEAEQARLAAEQEALQAERERLAAELGALKQEETALLHRRDQAQAVLSPKAVLDPVAAAAGVATDLARANTDLAAARDRVSPAEQALAANTQARIDAAAATERLKANRDLAVADLQRYTERTDAVTESLAAAGVSGMKWSDPLLTAALEAKRLSLAAERDRLAVALAQEQRWLGWLAGDERFLHPDIRTVAEQLGRSGLHPQTGLEWLGRQVPEPAEQAAVLARCQILPYALVLERAEFQRLARDPALLGGLLLSAPVPLLAAEARWFSDPEARLELLLPQHRGTAAFVSGSRQTLVAEAEERQRELRSRGATLESERQRLERAVHALAAHAQAYSADAGADLAAAQSAAATEYALACERQAEWAAAEARLSAAVTAAHQAAAAAAQQVSDLTALAAQLAAWRTDWECLPVLTGEIDLLTAQQRRLGEALSGGRDALAVAAKALLTARERLQLLRLEAESLQQRLRPFQTITPAAEAAGTLAEAQAAATALQEALQRRHADLADLKQQEDRLRREAADLADRIRLVHRVPVEQLLNVTEHVGVAAFAQLDRELDATRGELGRREQSVQKCNDRAQQQSGALLQLENAVRSRFGKSAAPLSGPVAGHQQRLAAIGSGLAMERAELTAAAAELATMVTAVAGASQRLQDLAQDCGGTPLDPGWHDPRQELVAYAGAAPARLRAARAAHTEAHQRWDKAVRLFDLVLQESAGGAGALLDVLRRDGESQLGAEELESLIRAARQASASIETELAIHGEVLAQLVQDCLMRARDVRAAVRDVPKSSMVQLAGEAQPRRLLVFELPGGVDDEERAMSDYLLALVSRLTALPPAGWMEAIRAAVEPGELLGVLVDLSQAVVRVAKVVSGGTASVLEAWEVVIAPADSGGWSEGEKYLGALTVHLCLQSHIRNRLCGADRSPLVLLSDNPFARMNAEHLLAPIGQLLEATATQWVCATGHRDHNIFRLFQIHYGLKLLPVVSGLTWVKGELQPNTLQLLGVEDPHPLHGPGRQRQRQATFFD